MIFKIMSWWSGSVLFSLETESIKLCLEAAVNSKADLRGANLRGANLRGANLYGANLRGANLYGAKGSTKYQTTPLLLLLDQPGKIRAYKLVTAEGIGPFNGGMTYKVGQSYSVENANTDETEQCGAGINLATMDWCLKAWREGYRILVAEFTAKDIAAIPTHTDGKFRVHRCKIVGEKNVAKLLPKKEEVPCESSS